MRTKLTNYLKSGHPGIYVVSSEEPRVEAEFKAASVGDEAAWLSFSDGAVCSTVMRLGEVAESAPPQGACPGAAGAEDTLIVMADGWHGMPATGEQTGARTRRTAT